MKFFKIIARIKIPAKRAAHKIMTAKTISSLKHSRNSPSLFWGGEQFLAGKLGALTQVAAISGGGGM